MVDPVITPIICSVATVIIISILTIGVQVYSYRIQTSEHRWRNKRVYREYAASGSGRLFLTLSRWVCLPAIQELFPDDMLTTSLDRTSGGVLPRPYSVGDHKKMVHLVPTRYGDIELRRIVNIHGQTQSYYLSFEKKRYWRSSRNKENERAFWAFIRDLHLAAGVVPDIGVIRFRPRINLSNDDGLKIENPDIPKPPVYRAAREPAQEPVLSQQAGPTPIPVQRTRGRGADDHSYIPLGSL